MVNNKFSQPHKFSMTQNKHNQNGVALLFVVIVISATALVFVVNAAFLGIGEADVGFTAMQGEESYLIAEGCAEESMRRIRVDSSYGIGVGEITLPLSRGTCTIEITANGSERTLLVKGTIDSYNKTLQIVGNIDTTTNEFSITSWEEVEG
jgi:hypothetical protein